MGKRRKFKLVPGVPDFREFWEHLQKGAKEGTLTPAERDLAKKLKKTVVHLRDDPLHPGLNSHEIPALSRQFGYKVWESYLENNTPSAGRLFWAYGPKRGMITLLAIEPHPEDAKRGAYGRIKLSTFPKSRE